MKILHLLSGGNVGGIETLCMDIAKYGAQEHTFCFLYAGGTIADKLDEQYHNIIRLYEEKLFLKIPRLIQIVDRERYEAVLVHHEGTRIYNCYLTLQRKFPHIKFVKYLHCSFEDKYFYTGNFFIDKINHKFLEKALYHSDRCIAVSQYVKKSYEQEYKQCKNRIEIVYNGASPQILDRSIEEHLQRQAERNVLYIGRLVDIKGCQVLIQAIKILKDKNCSLRLTILGDGADRNKYERLVSKLEIAESVSFKGFQLEKEAYYDDADIYVCPSLCEEAFGISIIEAMAHGLMCVASNKGGIPEILDDENGILVQNISPENLAQALEKAVQLCDSDERNKMLLKAKEDVKKFSIVETVKQLETFLKGV